MDIVFKTTDELFNNHVSNITNDTIIVCSYNDVNILDNLFDFKLKSIFEKKPNIGMVGVVGTNIINKNIELFKNNSYGHLIDGNNKININDGKYKKFGNIGFYDNIVAISDCFYAIRGSLILNGLKINNNKNYIVELCIDVLKSKYKIAVADILIYKHSTIDNIIIENDSINDVSLPITIKSFNFDRSDIVDVEI